MQASGDVGMVRAQGRFANGQRALEKRLGFDVLAQGAVAVGQIAQARGHFRCIGPQRRLANRQGLLI